MALLTHVRVSQYVAVDSPVHRLDARTKIVVTACLVLCTLLVGRPVAYLVLALLLLSVTATARLPWRLLWTTYRFVFLGIAVGAAVTAIVFPGHPFASTGRLLVTTRGAGVAVAVLALLASLLTSNQRLERLPRLAVYAVAAALALTGLFLAGAAMVHLGRMAVPLRLVLLALAAAAVILTPSGPQRRGQGTAPRARGVFLTLAAAGLLAAVLPERGLLHAGSFSVSRDGVTYGVRLLGQLTLLVYATGILTMTTPPLTLTAGLQRLLGWMGRLRVPVEEITLVVTLGLTFLPLIQQQFDQVLTAQLARGADFRRGSWEMRGRNALALFIPLLASNLRRADDLALAMEARGYTVGARRTHLQVQTMGPRDVAILTVTVVASIALVLIWRG
ncbi:MAG: hypothetical protein NVSMB65_14800 [Chloroflexota bacterium]